MHMCTSHQTRQTAYLYEKGLEYHKDERYQYTLHLLVPVVFYLVISKYNLNYTFIDMNVIIISYSNKRNHFYSISKHFKDVF